VRDRDEHGSILARLCGNDTAGVITSASSRLWVKFRTDASAHGRGFYAVYTSGPPVSPQSDSGVLWRACLSVCLICGASEKHLLTYLFTTYADYTPYTLAVRKSLLSLASPRARSIVMSVSVSVCLSVCLCVCLFVCDHILGTSRPI